MTVKHDDPAQSGDLYQVVFSGQLEEGVERAAAEKGVATLFNASPRQLALFFSGKRVVVKNGVSAAVAAKYQKAFKKVGAVCRVEPANPPAHPSTSPEPPSEPVCAPDDVKPVPPALRLAPTGARLGPQRRVAKGPDVDKDHFEVLPTGSDLGVEGDGVEQEAPNIDHLSMAPLGSRLEDESQEAQPAAPDISHLALDLPDEGRE